jgi:cystathionine gamma-synthase
MTEKLSPETLAAQALGEIDAASAALVPPIPPFTVYEANAGVPHPRLGSCRGDHAARLARKALREFSGGRQAS